MSDVLARAPEVFQEFVHLLITVLPYFLIGAVAGAALSAFVPERRSRLVFNQKNWLLGLFSAAGVGAILPGCSCATIPMAAGIKDSSKPPIAVVATFIFMSPFGISMMALTTFGAWSPTSTSCQGCIGFFLFIGR
ncbi:MAG: permease [Bdellovibrionales bacterium]